MSVNKWQNFIFEWTVPLNQSISLAVCFLQMSYSTKNNVNALNDQRLVTWQPTVSRSRAVRLEQKSERWNNRMWPNVSFTNSQREKISKQQICGIRSKVCMWYSSERPAYPASCPRGGIFTITLSGTSATSLRGREVIIWSAIRKQFGISVGKTAIEASAKITLGHCDWHKKTQRHWNRMKHEAVCLCLLQSNKASNVLTPATSNIRQNGWGTSEQQILRRPSQMHSVRLVDNFL